MVRLTRVLGPAWFFNSRFFFPIGNPANVYIFTLQTLKEAFKIFDKNHNGFIEVKELKEVTTTLGQALSEEEFKEFWREADINNDGKIDIEEFVKVMSQYWNANNQGWLTEIRFGG